MKNFDYTINSGSGRYSNLDKEYNKFLENTLRNIEDDDTLYKWDTYNMIMDELIKLGKEGLFNEIRY